MSTMKTRGRCLCESSSCNPGVLRLHPCKVVLFYLIFLGFKGSTVKQRHWWRSPTPSMTSPLLQTWDDLSMCSPLQQKMSGYLSLFLWGDIFIFYPLSILIVFICKHCEIGAIFEILHFMQKLAQMFSLPNITWPEMGDQTGFSGSLWQEREHHYRTDQVWGADCCPVWPS